MILFSFMMVFIANSKLFSTYPKNINRALSESCPYSATCYKSCYLCRDSTFETSCTDDLVISACTKYKPTCPQSSYNSKSGSKSFKIYPKSICFWEINLSSHISSSDYVLLSFNSNSSIPVSDFTHSISIISLMTLDPNIKPNKSYSPSTIYSPSSNKIKVQGNYLAIVCWYNKPSAFVLNINWDIQGSDSSKFILLILAVILPCVFVSCCFLCIYSYYRRRYYQTRPELRYQVMNRDEIANESFIDSVLPLKYYLVQADEVCPICFEHFSIGDEIRQPKCMHLYHAACLDEWIESKPVHYLCPMCKSELFDFKVNN